MINTSFTDSLGRTDQLPPMTLPKKVKRKDKWKKAVMDSFEHIALKQIHENLSFYDNYRMVDGTLTFQELSDVAPHLENLSELLSGVGVPTFLKHYDITSIIVNTILDKYVDFQDKFHVTDSGEVAQNEFLRFRDQEIQKLLKEVIENSINLALAEAGFNQEGKQFSSEEEQQAYLQQLEGAKKKFTPEDTEKSSKTKFKSIGVQWGEATLDHDKERFKLAKLGKENLKDMLISGRCFREYKIYHDKYQPVNWNPKTVFFSKEVGADEVQKGEYVGRVHAHTPGEVVKEFGHMIPANKQEELLGGNTSWKNFESSFGVAGTIGEAINSNFSKITETPFRGYDDYNFMLSLEDEIGAPMGIETVLNKDGTQTVRDRYLPRYHNGQAGIYNSLANLIRSDFTHRTDLCQVTEVYFRAYDLWGYLTYENENGRIVTEEVTEDILKDFIKENGIKETYKESVEQIIESFEVNTLKWQYRPVIYYGVKVQSANLSEPLYLKVEEMDHQIKGESDFDVLLPVAGKIGKSIVTPVAPFQAQYNLCLNQIKSLIEKELGVILLMSTDLIPSEYDGWGDAEDAFIQLRNTAKSVGIMPANMSLDSQKQMNNANPVQAINLSHAQEINTRVQMAEFFQRKAYELIGINPILNQPTKYETAEGVRLGNETNVSQIAGIHEDFAEFNKGALELHLAVAQYCQANKKDHTLYYTKSDASIEFLKMYDPNLPFRRLGLVATFDSKKRKELETYKQLLINTNTLGADTIELARLIGSDSFSEVIEIATNERNKKQEREDQAYQREQSLIQQKAEFDEANAQKEWDRNEVSKQRDRDNKLDIQRINSLGRASSNNADAEDFNQINIQADRSLKESDLNLRSEMQAKNFTLKEKISMDAKELKMKELELKAKEIEERAKSRQSAEYVATINKN